MQPSHATEADSAARVTPPAHSQAPWRQAPWRVVAVSAGSGKTLAVRFVDGTAGRVEMSRFLAARCVDGTLFEALRDDLLFAQVAVADGVIRWPNGADLAPDAMYDAIRESGCWLP